MDSVTDAMVEVRATPSWHGLMILLWFRPSLVNENTFSFEIV